MLFMSTTASKLHDDDGNDAGWLTIMIVIKIMNMGLRKGSFKKETEALKANIVIVSLS